jgi:hypothetical protein
MVCGGAMDSMFPSPECVRKTSVWSSSAFDTSGGRLATKGLSRGLAARSRASKQ